MDEILTVSGRIKQNKDDFGHLAFQLKLSEVERLAQQSDDWLKSVLMDSLEVLVENLVAWQFIAWAGART